jgi:hypothetical protein
MYTDKVYGVEPLGTPAAQVLTASAFHTYSKLFLSQMNIKRLAALVTTAVVSGQTVIVEFYDRPTPGSAAAQVLIGQVKLLTGDAVGTVRYKDIANYDMKPGHQLVFNVQQVANGGGAAGAVVYLVEGEDDPESPANQPSMVVSA